MKKIFLSALMGMLLINAQAQYKKAGFFNKSGRFYDVGTSYRLLGGGRDGGLGFFLSLGKESSEKRIHHWYDMEIVLGNNYSYISPATDGSGIQYQVSGKTGISFVLRYNFAYYLADNSSQDNSLLPFLLASLGYIRNAVNEETYSASPDGYPPKTPITSDPDFIFGLGGGIIYKVSPKVGLRLSAFYNTTLSNFIEDKVQYYINLPNHPSVSLAIRFMIDQGE